LFHYSSARLKSEQIQMVTVEWAFDCVAIEPQITINIEFIKYKVKNLRNM